MCSGHPLSELVGRIAAVVEGLIDIVEARALLASSSAAAFRWPPEPLALDSPRM